MPDINEKALKQQIKEGTFSRVYFLFGTEGYLKKHYANLIASKSVTKDFADFNLHRFEGKELKLEDLTELTETIPMFSEYRCTVIHDPLIEKMAKQELADFCTMLRNMPDSSIVVLWMDNIEVDIKKTAKWKTIHRQLSDIGNAVELNKMDSASIVKLITSGAQKRGCTIERDTAMYLLSTVGDDLHNLLNELDKLCSYVGEGEIKKSDIAAVAVKSVEASIYDLSKSLLSGNCERAFKILDTLLKQKVEPVVILGTLISTFVDMYRVKVAVAGGERPEYIAQLFAYGGREFRLRNAARDASGLSVIKLRQCLDELDLTDRLLKSSPVEPRPVLEQCIARLTLTAQQR